MRDLKKEQTKVRKMLAPMRYFLLFIFLPEFTHYPKNLHVIKMKMICTKCKYFHNLLNPVILCSTHTTCNSVVSCQNSLIVRRSIQLLQLGSYELTMTYRWPTAGTIRASRSPYNNKSKSTYRNIFLFSTETKLVG